MFISEADYGKLTEENRIHRESVKGGQKWHEALGITAKTALVNPLGGAASTEYALAVENKDISDFGSSLTVEETDTGEPLTADGSAASVTYMGIDGNLICNDASACSSLDGKLTGDWYFVATGTDATAGLVKKGKVYVPRSEVAYADWGVWIEADSGTGAGSGREIRWHASGNVFGTDNSGNLNLAADTTSRRTLNSATYKGDAHGVSRYGKDVGAFKATASLTATFNDTPMLKGEISGFEGGNAVNETWKLVLENTEVSAATGRLSAAGETEIGTVGETNDVSGEETWNAQLYGEAGKRPDGVVGNFDGRFTDGQVVGVFQAK